MENLRARFRGLRSEGFVRSAGALVGGTALAQAIMVLVLPLLTRLYTPEDFSVLAVYVSILGITTVVACMGLELAIPMPEHDEEAANLLALALASSATVGAIASVAVALCSNDIVILLDQPRIQPYLWMFPLGVWLSSTYTALQYWATRKKRFPVIAKTRFAQAVGGAGTQALIGWGGSGAFGLLLGHMISSSAGILSLGRSAAKQDWTALRTIRLPAMLGMLREYQRFPKYGTLEGLTNNAGIQLPMIFIASLAVGPEAGFLMLAIRVMQAPMALIGGAVGQVYLSRAPQELRLGRLAAFTSEVVTGLAKVGVGPVLFISIIAPPVFAIVFGPEWRRAGELLAWMAPWFVFQLLSSPISMVMHVRNFQKYLLAVTSSGLVLRVGAIAVAAKVDRLRFAEYYAIGSGVFYFGCYWVFSRAAGISFGNMSKLFARILPLVMAWTIAGILLRVLLGWWQS